MKTIKHILRTQTIACSQIIYDIFNIFWFIVIFLIKFLIIEHFPPLVHTLSLFLLKFRFNHWNIIIIFWFSNSNLFISCLYKLVLILIKDLHYLFSFTFKWYVIIGQTFIWINKRKILRIEARFFTITQSILRTWIYFIVVIFFN